LTSGEHYNIHHRALEKDPEDRYQSVADMVGELRREQKKPARVIRPPVPNALADVLHAGQPVVTSKKRAALLSALCVGCSLLRLCSIFQLGITKP
jgi:hypothetical protein